MSVKTARNGKNSFAEIYKQLGLLPGYQGLNSNLEESTQTPNQASSALDIVRREAEVIASDIVSNYEKTEKKCPDRYCKTMRKTVKEISDRHDIAFKGMVNKLNIGEMGNNAFDVFVTVANEIFEDGQINWGRVIAVYAFAARLAAYFRQNQPDMEEKIALYVGKYVGNKLGHWIVDNGGWDAFADYFSDQSAVEDKIWKGLLFTAALGGIGALAVMAR